MPLHPTSLTATASGHSSPWHSPVPYLFGGLAAMMGLIAFALLILACSYWKLSRNLQTGDSDDDRDLEAGDVKPDNNKTPVVTEEKYLVIMAGQEKPTFLAAPSSSRSSSFGCNSCRSCSTTTLAEELSTLEKEKEVSSDVVQASIMGNQVS